MKRALLAGSLFVLTAYTGDATHAAPHPLTPVADRAAPIRTRGNPALNGGGDRILRATPRPEPATAVVPVLGLMLLSRRRLVRWLR